MEFSLRFGKFIFRSVEVRDVWGSEFAGSAQNWAKSKYFIDHWHKEHSIFLQDPKKIIFVCTIFCDTNY